MTIPQSHSQCGQDAFVYHVLQHQQSGYFIDIGCADPVQYNNTYAFEQLGWTGLCFDEDKHPDWDSKRKSPIIVGDACWTYFEDVFRDHNAPYAIDYLSLDVDQCTLAALLRLPIESRPFKVITIEHDRYRFGESLRAPQRHILNDFGYELVCGDVAAQLGDREVQFEDWWVHPRYVDKAIIDQLHCSGVRFEEILARIQQCQPNA